MIERFDGYIAQYLGDGLLIYFGWPTAHEDDAQRALHAGLGIVDAITTTLNPRLEQEKGVTLTVRLGVHTGPVVVGEMGGGGRQEDLATGETVNIAARLEGLAAPNTVVISAVTERLVQRAFALEDLGPQVLKGVAEPIPAFRVIGPMADDEDEPTTIGIPGRDEEVGLLLRRWEQSKEGHGQVVLLSGEAGIGKSSLLSTVRQQVVREGYTRMTVRCSPYHTNSALYPVIEHVQRALQFQPGDPPATRLDKLECVLGDYSRPLEEVMPLYADLLSLPLPEGRYTPLNLTPQQQRQQTQDALLGWLLEEAERQPMLVMWEDLQWVDPSTLEYLGLVLEQTPTVPMLHVLTYRPEFTPPWPSRSHMTPLTLNRLERPQVGALITQLTAGKALPTEVVEHIVAKTDGVPLYVEELTRMLLESELLRQDADRYVLTGPLLSVAIPDTLQDSLMARLDRMNTTKEVAQLGAVLGREFAYDVIQGLSPQDETTLQDGLTRYAWWRQAQATIEQAEVELALAAEHDFPLWQAGGTMNRGMALTELGQHEEGLNQLQEGIAAWRAIGSNNAFPMYLGWFADVSARTGRTADAQAALTEALTLVQTTGERIYEVELYRLKGALLLSLSPDNQVEAETYFHQALDVARSQQAKSRELRAQPAWPTCGSHRASARRPTICPRRCMAGSRKALTRRI